MSDPDHLGASLRVLVTGATGYIGGRLVPRLLEAGHRVRALARDPNKISDVPWACDVEVVRGDLTDPDWLDDACRDIDVVYYLVHSMGGPGAPKCAFPAGPGWSGASNRAAPYHPPAPACDLLPERLGGQLYWYVLKPLRGIVFTGMANDIAGAANSRSYDLPRIGPQRPSDLSFRRESR